MTLQIVGETKVYGRIRTLYKMKFNTAKEATKFFKLLKALFILQIGLPYYFNFTTNINDNGELQLYLDDQQVKYENLLEFVALQYRASVELKDKTEIEIEELKQKLDLLKKESIKLEKDYLEKEKNISTYLECKKSFFGKVKYFFSGSKKAKKVKDKKDSKEEIIKTEKKQIERKQIEDRNYTLDELIMSFKDLKITENSMRNIVQDINAIKLKNKNLKKKIENATLYINEINKHKKSIFEFWKYSNKDEVAALEEGEEEEINVSKVEKAFNYDEDFETFGETVDKNQRLKFTDLELDSSYIASTNLLGALNDILNKKYVELTEYNKMLEKIKIEDSSQIFDENMDFDIFGNEDGGKERTLGSKTHRESPRTMTKVLEISKNTKGQDLKEKLGEISRNLKKAIKKNELEEDIYVYKALDEKTTFEGLESFSLNEENELNQAMLKSNKNNIYLYKIKLPKGTNFIAFSNIVLYNNKNMTLPLGMRESNRVLVDSNDLRGVPSEVKVINVEYLENKKDDFSDVIMKKIQIYES